VPDRPSPPETPQGAPASPARAPCFVLPIAHEEEAAENIREAIALYLERKTVAAIEVQLDPEMGPRERTRRLRKVLRRIAYWQASNQHAARSHRKERLRRLHRLGIRLTKLKKCFNVS